jgi:putative salt-induced outer membrane protein YdiY
MYLKVPRRLRPVLFVLLSCCIAPVPADEVVMKNGDRLTGTVVRLLDGELVFKTAYAGEISIAWADIQTLKTDQPVTVLLEDDTLLTGELVPAPDGGVAIRAEDLAETEILGLSRVSYINPPPEISGRGVTVDGRANVGVLVQKGNTDTETYHADIETVITGRINRITGFAELNQQADTGRETANNWRASGKYDHFLDPAKRQYLFANVGFEHDKFKDLDLRSTFGGGYGYRVWADDIRNLDLELGANYVNEDFIVAADNGFAAGRWLVNFDHYLFRKHTQFFHRNLGLFSLENTRDVVIRTRTGFRFPLIARLNATVQVDVYWDGDPPPNTKSTDTRTSVNLGYTW